MNEEAKTFTYKVEDIFNEIPGDSDNINLTLPPEVCEEVGLVPGDDVKVLIGDQGTVIIEKIKKDKSGEETETEN